jgi:hypothetical protein
MVITVSVLNLSPNLAATKNELGWHLSFDVLDVVAGHLLDDLLAKSQNFFS